MMMYLDDKDAVDWQVFHIINIYGFFAIWR